MKEKLLEILEEVKPGFEFEGKTGLIDNGDLDSFDVISLVAELNEEFDIDIPVEDIVTENFDSVETMLALISRLGERNNIVVEMKKIENINQYKRLVKDTKNKYGKLQTNCFLFYSEFERFIIQERAFFKEVFGGVLFLIDEGKYFQVYYYISSDCECLNLDRQNKPLLIRTIYVKENKSLKQKKVDNILLKSGFTLLDTTTQVWTNAKDNYENMGKMYSRMENLLDGYGLKMVIAEPQHLDAILELRDSTPELKIYHIPFQTREEELHEIEEGHYACILNQKNEICAARKIEIDNGNLYSPWFCVKKEYKDKYGLGIIMTGFEMKYACEHSLEKVYGWIADDNTGSWNYHKRLGVQTTGKAADEWILR